MTKALLEWETIDSEQIGDIRKVVSRGRRSLPNQRRLLPRIIRRLRRRLRQRRQHRKLDHSGCHFMTKPKKAGIIPAFSNWRTRYRYTSHLSPQQKFVSPSHYRPLVMGIVNVTPDSFSDGGLFDSFEQALQHATQLIEQGEDWLDVGGESTRPGSMPVDVKRTAWCYPGSGGTR